MPGGSAPGKAGGSRFALGNVRIGTRLSVAFGVVAVIVGEYGRPLGMGDLWYLTGVHGGAFLLLGVLADEIVKRVIARGRTGPAD